MPWSIWQNRQGAPSVFSISNVVIVWQLIMQSVQRSKRRVVHAQEEYGKDRQTHILRSIAGGKEWKGGKRGEGGGGGGGYWTSLWTPEGSLQVEGQTKALQLFYMEVPAEFADSVGLIRNCSVDCQIPAVHFECFSGVSPGCFVGSSAQNSMSLCLTTTQHNLDSDVYYSQPEGPRS